MEGTRLHADEEIRRYDLAKFLGDHKRSLRPYGASSLYLFSLSRFRLCAAVVIHHSFAGKARELVYKPGIISLAQL